MNSALVICNEVDPIEASPRVAYSLLDTMVIKPIQKQANKWRKRMKVSGAGKHVAVSNGTKLEKNSTSYWFKKY